jgi:hypothetical protein
MPNPVMGDGDAGVGEAGGNERNRLLVPEVGIHCGDKEKVTEEKRKGE